jgi:predicted protein tyrosine phosphatase
MTPFRITVCGIEELGGHCAAGVSHVLSILDPEWPVPEAFGGYGEHARLELRFHDVIEDGADPAATVPATVAPEADHVARLLAFGRDLAAEGATTATAHLLIHCHAGVSRSTAAMALILAQALPEAAAEAILAEVVRIRPQAWPNLRIIELGDALLRRRGTLVAAAGGLYRARLGARPELAALLRQGGRGREVAAAGA